MHWLKPGSAGLQLACVSLPTSHLQLAMPLPPGHSLLTTAFTTDVGHVKPLALRRLQCTSGGLTTRGGSTVEGVLVLTGRTVHERETGKHSLECEFTQTRANDAVRLRRRANFLVVTLEMGTREAAAFA